MVEGKIVHQQTGNFLDTNGVPGAKWIFVMSTSKRLYAGEVRIVKLLWQLLVCNNMIFLLCIFVFKAVSYYIQKKKGVFHHSTFLAGGATLAAGRLVVVNGILKVHCQISVLIF